MSGVILYSQGAPSRDVYRVLSGEVRVKRDDLELKPITAEGLLIGTFEMLLSQSPFIIPDRFFTITASSNSQFEKVPVEEVEDIYRDFTSGMQANTFISTLIHQTNVIIEALSGGPIWRRYEHFAQAFYEAVTKVEALNEKHKIREIDKLLAELDQYHLVRYGRAHFGTPQSTTVTVGEFRNDPIVKKEEGDFVCRLGEKFTGLYVLLEGSVSIRRGSRVIGVIDSEGEALGELSLFLDTKRTADVIAREPSTFLYVTRASLPAFHEKHPLLFFEVARSLSRRLQCNLLEIDETRWVLSKGSEVLLRRERDQFLERFQTMKTVASPNELAKLLVDIDRTLATLRG